MGIASVQRQMITPQVIHSMGEHVSQYRAITNTGGAPAALTWVANLAIYIPFAIPFAYQVNQMYWCNGSTITTSSADVGIYSSEGTRLYSSGAIALSGASSLQFVSPGVLLDEGEYFMAYMCTGTTSRAYGITTWTATMLRQMGIMQEATAGTLPAVATFAAATSAVYPLFGMSRESATF